MKKYTFSNTAATWWAEYQTDGMQTTDNLRILGIRSQSIGGVVNPTDIDDAMIALGLPNHYGGYTTEVELKALAASLNLNLAMTYEAEASSAKYAALAVQATPTFSPAAGAVAWGATITIASPGSSAIYYTLDGTVPDDTSTKQATTACVVDADTKIVKAVAYSTTKYHSLIGSAVYTQAVAAAPTNVVLAVGTANPVASVVNVAIPAAGATDATGSIVGWATGTADTVKITVTNAANTASTLTINGEEYTSGENYVIAAVTPPLTVVLTTTRENYATAVRTFTIPIAAAV